MQVKQQKIIFTGGGSAGHVTPNLALIAKFLQEGWRIDYIGSKTGVEKELITKIGIPYYAVATGKLRRYFSWQNFLDPFKVVCGIIQASILCFKLQPDMVFSKGGFVSFPVVVAAWIFRLPVVIHESDLTIGLANKLCFPFATKICVTFPETAQKISDQKKVVITGTPIRQDFFVGSADLGRKICGFTLDKKIIAVFGGSQGAERINQLIRTLLPEILKRFQLIHVCGHNRVDSSYIDQGYKQFEYLHQEFPHVLAAANLVIARAGANSIYELIALGKPSILLPLVRGSRGDQIANAKYCVAAGFSRMILEEQLTARVLLDTIYQVEQESAKMMLAMKQLQILPSTQLIYSLISDLIT